METAGETEVLGENSSQCHSVHHKSHMMRPGIEPGSPRWEAGDTNRDMAFFLEFRNVYALLGETKNRESKIGIKTVRG
jgi:hypothetical protein